MRNGVDYELQNRKVIFEIDKFIVGIAYKLTPRDAQNYLYTFKVNAFLVVC